VSARTYEGIEPLLQDVNAAGKRLLPTDGTVALNSRQAATLGSAASALSRAAAMQDITLIAEELRLARAAFDRLTGRAGTEHLLDGIFGRFCLGK
jgi:tRNA modification GTPase